MGTKKKVRFERHPSQVVFDPSSSSFVVTWSKCGKPVSERLASGKNPLAWIPSISAIVELCDRGCVHREWAIPAAKAVARAWDAGDRCGLDTDDAKKAAELVRDLSYVYTVSSDSTAYTDVWQAIRCLIDAMAKVRFMSLPLGEFEDDRIMPAIDKAVSECFTCDEFAVWQKSSMRRKFLYGIKRKDRTMVVYTLAALLFDSGACPILSIKDKYCLRVDSLEYSGLSADFSTTATIRFLKHALSVMREAKAKCLSICDTIIHMKKISKGGLPEDEKQKGEVTCNS